MKFVLLASTIVGDYLLRLGLCSTQVRVVTQVVPVQVVSGSFEDARESHICGGMLSLKDAFNKLIKSRYSHNSTTSIKSSSPPTHTGAEMSWKAVLNQSETKLRSENLDSHTSSLVSIFL